MRKLSIAVAMATCAIAMPLAAQMDVMVGGQAMSPRKDIITNALNSADHTTLVAAVKAAGLVPTLQGKGPFTVFAPTNEAFAALPAGTVDNLKPENRGMLTKAIKQATTRRRSRTSKGTWPTSRSLMSSSRMASSTSSIAY